MKTRKIIALLAMAFIVLAATSCEEDEELFLKRSHDALSFSYFESTQELIVLSNGRWQIEPNDSWISVSPAEGVGDGHTEQKVGITVAQNDEGERTGSVTLTDGVKQLTVAISQEDGFFTLSKPTMSPSYNIDEALVDKYVEIPYQKGKTNYSIDVDAALSGPGAEGLEIESLKGYRPEAGNSSIKLSITGTPTKKGNIEVALAVNITTTGKKYDFVAQSRAKFADEITVKVFKVLPRLAVIDWGDYERGTGSNGLNPNVPRSYVFVLAETEEGPALRLFDAPTAKWCANGMFFAHNRFAFGNLKPNTTYWFRIIAREQGPDKEDSSVTTLAFKTPEEVIESNTILYKDFDDFSFGGSPFYQAFGTTISNNQCKGLDPNDPEQILKFQTVCSPVFSTSSYLNYISATSGVISSVEAAALWSHAYDGDEYGTNYKDADYPGWQGWWARHTTGGILLGTASLPGYLKTPKLRKLGDTPSNITVTCRTAPYFEPHHSWGEDHNQHYIKIEGPGTIADGGPTLSEPTGAATANSGTQVTVACKPNVDPGTKNPLYDQAFPTEHVVKITGATKETRIVIESHPYGTKHYRLWIDDIQVTKD